MPAGAPPRKPKGKPRSKPWTRPAEEALRASHEANATKIADLRREYRRLYMANYNERKRNPDAGIPPMEAWGEWSKGRGGTHKTPVATEVIIDDLGKPIRPGTVKQLPAVRSLSGKRYDPMARGLVAAKAVARMRGKRVPEEESESIELPDLVSALAARDVPTAAPAPRAAPEPDPEPDDDAPDRMGDADPRIAAIRREIARITQEKAKTDRLRKVAGAKQSLLDFAQVTMPDVNSPNDPLSSRYKPSRHHLALIAALEKVEAGEWLNLVITMPPRHGKSEIATRRMIPWFVGKMPTRSVALGTYSEDLAGDFGRDVRAIMEAPLYQELFPEARLRKGSKSADRMQTEAGGMLFFVGRGQGITGRGADLIIIDDPLKNREEADSKATRDKVWKWWQDDISSRILDETGRFIVIQTRWHEDDLVGRLTDPANPHFVEEEAAKWRVLELPALAGENDALGRAPGEALWPERFGRAHLEAIRVRNPRGFASLYQGRPSPEEGDDFKVGWLQGYRPGDYPKNAPFYAASDHAVKTGQENDKTCFGGGVVGEDGLLYISPDLKWDKFTPDVTVKEMLAFMRRANPIYWWAENDHISMAFGPFLRQAMRKNGVWCVIEPVTVRKDKRTMATAARGMLEAGLIRFPTFAPWWPDARDQLLKFPNATHDDFVTFLTMLCLGVDRMVKKAPVLKAANAPVTGTVGWIVETAKRERKAKSRQDGY